MRFLLLLLIIITVFSCKENPPIIYQDYAIKSSDSALDVWRKRICNLNGIESISDSEVVYIDSYANDIHFPGDSAFLYKGQLFIRALNGHWHLGFEMMEGIGKSWWMTEELYQRASIDYRRARNDVINKLQNINSCSKN